MQREEKQLVVFKINAKVDSKDWIDYNEYLKTEFQDSKYIHILVTDGYGETEVYGV